MGSNDPKTPTIARIWRGRTRPERADEYETYNYEAGIKPLIEKALGVQTFRDDRENETEFMTISYWESVEAMAAFARDDPMATGTCSGSVSAGAWAGRKPPARTAECWLRRRSAASSG